MLSAPGSSLIPSELSAEENKSDAAVRSLATVEDIGFGFPGCPASIAAQRTLGVGPASGSERTRSAIIRVSKTMKI
jgi:hypothetical protein